ncbi:MAG: site-specific DNA-methyltransferase [Gammaproteobacteria bacterium]|nr:site-specific DNA-methyltransferase [Gammaproteobacteria bacterium]
MPSASTPALLGNPEPRGLKESWRSRDGESRLVRGDHMELLASLPADSVDCIWTDPPYFLSNGGTSCHAGKRVAVHKGAWDQSQGVAADHAFNRTWLAECRRVLKPSGTIWVSGTHHVYLSVGMALMELGYRLLNDIVWEKPNPPPNLGCRCFTHATEMILWASKSAKGAQNRYTFNYADMKAENDGRQMKNVWRFTAPGTGEKRHGKHPTQKPLALVERCLLASTHPGDLVLDPFAGSASTGVAALGAGRRFIGAEIDTNYCKLASKRLTAADLARPPSETP